MWINEKGQLYVGDCAEGDREATDDEVTSWQVGREKNVIQSQVDAMLAIAKVQDQWQIQSGMAALVALAAVQGVSEPQLYADNPGYRHLKDINAQIDALKAQLK